MAGLALAAPAEAASAKYPRVIPVDASGSFLVYGQKTASVSGLLITKNRALYYVGTTGGRHALRDFDPELFPTIQGSTLTQSAQPNSIADPGHDDTLPGHVRWRDLKTGARGVTDIPAGDRYVGAAPGGWIAVRSTAAGTGAHVLRYSTSGAATDLGAPMAGSSLFSVAPGPKGVVAYSRNGDDTNGTGLIRYMPYSTPGRWRTLLAAGPGRSTFCGRPTGTAVVCEARTSKHSGQVLLSLTSSRRVWVDDHRTVCQTNAFVAVGSTAVARESTTSRTCRNRRLTQISMTGRVTYSKALSGEHGASITDGLGGILLMSADQRRIVSISDVRAKPRTVVTAH